MLQSTQQGGKHSSGESSPVNFHIFIWYFLSVIFFQVEGGSSLLSNANKLYNRVNFDLVEDAIPQYIKASPWGSYVNFWAGSRPTRPYLNHPARQAMDRWTSSSHHKSLADLEALKLSCKAAEDRLLLANQLHAERAQEFEAKHSTLQERCKTAAALAEQHRLAHARQGEVTRAVQAWLDALTGAHHCLKTAHDALQAKHSTLLASHQSCIALLSSAFSCLKAF